MTVLAAVGALVVGLVVLVRAADVFVGAAEAVAVGLRWSPAVIGALVVGFGTSLPELVTSAAAAFAGEPDLAVGNAAGSNVANLLLILGVAALVAPLRGTGAGAPGRDVTVAAGAGLLLLGLSLSGELGLADGVVLLAALLGASAWQILSARAGRSQGAEDAELSRGAEVSRAAEGAGVAEGVAASEGVGAVEGAGVAEGAAARPLTAPLVGRLTGGLVGVIVGAQLLVWGAIQLATGLGVPAIIIGSVLVAIGTSLPELATAIASARRGQTELLIGNLIGSNAFNALAVVGVAALVGAARSDVLAVDGAALAVVAAAGGVTAVIGVWLWRLPRVGRVAGGALVAAYVVAVPLLVAVS